MEISGLDLAIVYHMIDLIKDKKNRSQLHVYMYILIHVEGGPAKVEWGMEISGLELAIGYHMMDLNCVKNPSVAHTASD